VVEMVGVLEVCDVYSFWRIRLSLFAQLFLTL
jgi:hypothetical protein